MTVDSLDALTTRESLTDRPKMLVLITTPSKPLPPPIVYRPRYEGVLNGIKYQGCKQSTDFDLK